MCSIPVLKFTCAHLFESSLSPGTSMQSVLTKISAFPYVPLLKYALGSLIHATSASDKIGFKFISNKSCTNFVFTVPIFLNAALPAVINCTPLLAKTEFPVSNIDGTFQLFKSSNIFSSKAPTKCGSNFNRLAALTQFFAKSLTECVANVTNIASPGFACDNSGGIAPS